MTYYHAPDAYGELSNGIGKVLLDEETIHTRILEMGTAVSRDYDGCNPLLVGVLKGVFPFMADLMRAITIPMEADYIAVASYTPESRQKGLVRLEKDLGEPIRGRHVLFVEDMIDTGLTLNYLLRNLKSREPLSLSVCTLFDKPSRRLITNLPVKYKGFELPDLFVVGYGLDYRERFRNLPFVAQLKPEVFQPSVE